MKSRESESQSSRHNGKRSRKVSLMRDRWKGSGIRRTTLYTLHLGHYIGTGHNCWSTSRAIDRTWYLSTRSTQSLGVIVRIVQYLYHPRTYTPRSDLRSCTSAQLLNPHSAGTGHCMRPFSIAHKWLQRVRVVPKPEERLSCGTVSTVRRVVRLVKKFVQTWVICTWL